jgi:hypothetical protein
LFETSASGGIGMNPEWFLERNFSDAGSYTC